MNDPIRIFSYLPNPRVWKAQIAGQIAGVPVEVRGAKAAELATWLWDFDARPLAESERTAASPYARPARRGFSGTLFKTDKFLSQHPFGTVPAAFSPDGSEGIFESNSILRAVARANPECGLYGRTHWQASRIDGFLDANLVFSREAQVWLLALGNLNLPSDSAAARRMKDALEFYFDGIERALGDSPAICGDEITIADISFACDTAQFLRERSYASRLAEAGIDVASRDAEVTWPGVFSHLERLVATPPFDGYLSRYLRTDYR